MTRMFCTLVAAIAASGCIVVADDDPYLAPYEPCSRSSQCLRPSDGCYDVVADYGSYVAYDGMCSLGCGDDTNCPAWGACYSVGGSPYLCWQRCGSDFDCAPGWGCIETIGGASFDAICLPR